MVPLTRNIDRLYPCEAYDALEGKQRKAMTDQIATVAKQRLADRIGQLSGADMSAVARAIKVQLDI